jgi:hypothetical protein
LRGGIALAVAKGMVAAIPDRLTLLLARQLRHMLLDPLFVIGLLAAIVVALVWALGALSLWHAC